MVIKNYNSTDVGLVRKANEDCMGQAMTPNGHLYVVCDGMGGHLGGATASKIGVDCIIEYVNKKPYENIGEMLVAAVKFANTQVFAKAVYDPQLKGMGSTCVILLITLDGNAWTCHVGDSRIYLFRNSKLSRLTKDHSYVQFLVDTGEIKEEEAEKHPNKNQILRALGSDEDIKPELCAVPFKPENNDLFLLCSDGLTGMVDEEGIASRIKSTSLPDTPEKLVADALANGGRDNVTVSLVEVTDMPKIITAFSKRKNTSNEVNLLGKIKQRRRLLFVFVALFALSLGSAYYFVFYQPRQPATNKSGGIKDSLIAPIDTNRNKLSESTHPANTAHPSSTTPKKGNAGISTNNSVSGEKDAATKKVKKIEPPKPKVTEKKPIHIAPIN